MPVPFRLSSCALLLILAACSRAPEPEPVKQDSAHAEAAAPPPRQEKKKDTGGEGGEKEHAESNFVKLSDKQIQAAQIEVTAVRTAFSGAVEAPAVIVADPEHAAVVSSSVSGRVVAVRKNLGERVAKGDVLALIESREVAQLSADLALARRQLELAEAGFKREDRLYAEKVSSRQDFEVAQSARDEARTRLQLAQQQLTATGGAERSGQLALRAPIAGVITMRQIGLGDVVEANARLFELANPSTLSVEMSFTPADAGRVAANAAVEVTAEERSGTATLAFVSRVLDPATRQIRAIAALPNPRGTWRIGETVTASVAIGGDAGGQLAVPRTAVQNIEDKPSVFVRDKEGFAIRHVVLGKPAAGFITVVSGLDGSERIATSNTYILKAEHGKGEAGEDHD